MCALLHPCERLHTVRLTGCYRLTTAALTALCEARGAGLRSLTVTGNSQLGPPAIAAIGARCLTLTLTLTLPLTLTLLLALTLALAPTGGPHAECR